MFNKSEINLLKERVLELERRVRSMDERLDTLRESNHSIGKNIDELQSKIGQVLNNLRNLGEQLIRLW